jgi:hypothetical protein
MPYFLRAYLGEKDKWLFERLWEIKMALNGSWRDVLEYLVTGKAYVRLPPVIPVRKTTPTVFLKKIKHQKNIHIYKVGTKKPWLDKYKGRDIYSLYATTGIVSGRLLITRVDNKIVVINASLATPPLSPSDYAEHAKILLKAFVNRLNRLCREWDCEDIVVDEEARSYFSYLEEVIHKQFLTTPSKTP